MLDNKYNQIDNDITERKLSRKNNDKKYIVHNTNKPKNFYLSLQIPEIHIKGVS